MQLTHQSCASVHDKQSVACVNSTRAGDALGGWAHGARACDAKYRMGILRACVCDADLGMRLRRVYDEHTVWHGRRSRSSMSNSVHVTQIVAFWGERAHVGHSFA